MTSERMLQSLEGLDQTLKQFTTSMGAEQKNKPILTLNHLELILNLGSQDIVPPQAKINLFQKTALSVIFTGHLPSCSVVHHQKISAVVLSVFLQTLELLEH